MNWISFKEQLPPLDEPVLVLRQDKDRAWIDYLYRSEYDNPAQEGEAEWCLVGEFNNDIYGHGNDNELTHWLAIPKPPLRKKRIKD